MQAEDIKQLFFTVIEMTEVWTTMSTVSVLDPIPSIREAPTIDYEKNKEFLIQWAKEYLELQDVEVWEFLKKKIKKRKFES